MLYSLVLTVVSDSAMFSHKASLRVITPENRLNVQTRSDTRQLPSYIDSVHDIAASRGESTLTRLDTPRVAVDNNVPNHERALQSADNPSYADDRNVHAGFEHPSQVRDNNAVINTENLQQTENDNLKNVDVNDSDQNAQIVEDERRQNTREIIASSLREDEMIHKIVARANELTNRLIDLPPQALNYASEHSSLTHNENTALDEQYVIDDEADVKVLTDRGTEHVYNMQINAVKVDGNEPSNLPMNNTHIINTTDLSETITTSNNVENRTTETSTSNFATQVSETTDVIKDENDDRTTVTGPTNNQENEKVRTKIKMLKDILKQTNIETLLMAIKQHDGTQPAKRTQSVKVQQDLAPTTATIKGNHM